MRAFSLVIGTALLGLLAGCGRFGISVWSAGDAGVTQPDAGRATRDAGSARDAGTASDAGAASDASATNDAGVVRDAGVVPDAGAARDSGVGVPDAGGADAGCPVECANAHGGADCSAGMCQLSCDTGYANCDGDDANGCEANTVSDPAHCGSCGTACDSSFQRCESSSCQVSMCPAGRGDCDAVTSDCETDLTNSLADCGACDNVCSAVNGTPLCAASSCGIAACNAGFDNCDGQAANGCETALNTIAACGSCSNACPNAIAEATPTCSGSACGYTCNNLAGVYALRITAQASWPAKMYILAGSGTLQFWLRLTLAQAGTALTGTMALCAQTTPETRNSVTTDRYMHDYPSVLFAPGPPAASFSATLASTAPGAALTAPRAAHLAGLSMSDALNGTWPARATVRSNQVDHDGDGKVGITVNFVDNATYNYAQTDGTLTAARASAVYGAQRLRFSLAGALTGCTGASGTATVQSFDTKAIGCRLESGTDCSASQYGHLDDNAAVFTAGSSSYVMTKLGATGSSFTCAQVRAAL